MSRKTPTLALALILLGCHSSRPIPQAPQAVQTQHVRLDSGAAGGRSRFSAVVEPDAQVPVSFRVPGYVVAIKQVRGQDGGMRDIAEGDHVSKGTVLVRIRAEEYEATLRQSAAQAAAAEAVERKAVLDFERATSLYATQSMTKPDFDAARAQFDAARSQLEAARASTSGAEIALRDTAVVAPFEGEIVAKSVELGSFVGPGTPVFVLARTDRVKIVIGVPDIALPAVTLGQPVDVRVDAYGGRSFQARISRVATAADPRTGNFEVEVAIPNGDHALKAGMIGSLELGAPEDATPQASVRVPLSAIVQAGEDGYGVYVVTGPEGEETAKLRAVEIGPVIGTEITVLRGLADGDEVITSGANLLKDAQRVEIVK